MLKNRGVGGDQGALRVSINLHVSTNLITFQIVVNDLPTLDEDGQVRDKT